MSDLGFYITCSTFSKSFYLMFIIRAKMIAEMFSLAKVRVKATSKQSNKFSDLYAFILQDFSCIFIVCQHNSTFNRFNSKCLSVFAISINKSFNCNVFIKKGQSLPLFHLFSSFQKHITFLQQINVKNVDPVYGARIRTHYLQNMSLLP